MLGYCAMNEREPYFRKLEAPFGGLLVPSVRSGIFLASGGLVV